MGDKGRKVDKLEEHEKLVKIKKSQSPANKSGVPLAARGVCGNKSLVNRLPYLFPFRAISHVPSVRRHYLTHCHQGIRNMLMTMVFVLS